MMHLAARQRQRLCQVDEPRCFEIADSTRSCAAKWRGRRLSLGADRNERFVATASRTRRGYAAGTSRIRRGHVADTSRARRSIFALPTEIWPDLSNVSLLGLSAALGTSEALARFFFDDARPVRTQSALRCALLLSK